EHRIGDLHRREGLGAIEPAELEGGCVAQVGRVHRSLLWMTHEARAERPDGRPPVCGQGRPRQGPCPRGPVSRACNDATVPERTKECDDRRRHQSLERRSTRCPTPRPQCSAPRIPSANSLPPSPSAWELTPTWRRSSRATSSAPTSLATTRTASS